MEQSTIVRTFTRELRNVEGKAVNIQKLEDGVGYILKVASERDAKLVVRSEFPFAEKMDLDNILDNSGIKVVNVSSLTDPRDIIKDAQIGITGADFAIAESGSIGVVAHRKVDVLVSALPLIHIALVDQKDIVPTYTDLKEILQRYLNYSNKARNNIVSLITGPSRSADIEQQHILGVHGPNQLHVLVVKS